MSSMQVCVLLTEDTNPISAARPRPLRILFHPQCMEKLGLIAGDLVQVSSQSACKSLGIIWPSRTVSAEHISVSQHILDTASLLEGSTATLSLVSVPAVHAAIINLVWLHTPEFHIDEALSIYVKEILLETEYVCSGQMVRFQYYGKERLCMVDQITPIDPIQINSDPHQIIPFRLVRSTRVRFEQAKSTVETRVGKVEYSTIGGLGEQISTVRSLVELTLCNPEHISCLGFRPPRGILLFGPPGTGKTLLARAVAYETSAHVITVNGSEIMSRFHGEAETRLHHIFQEANEKSPSIIFLDEIDALCPKRDEGATEVHQRIVAALLTLMDGINTYSSKTTQHHRLVVIGATNRPNAIDDALRRPGRFDHEIEIGIPSEIHRFEILQALLKKVPNSLNDMDLRTISANAHGYVGADLAAICREAGLKAIQRIEAESLNAGVVQTDDEMHLLDLQITLEDMRLGMSMVQPSAMREVTLEVPKVKWTDIGGQEDVKQRLREAVEWPLKHPEAFLKFNISPPKGILLYGPPGCSKTLMAKALATEAGLNFLAVKGPELFSKWVGESEKAVQEIFRKARAASPSIIFFDEIDALAVRRGGDDASVADRVLSQLLNELDGIEPLINVTIVAATNRPDILDTALLRPGRIDSILYVSPPDADSREQIFRIQTNRMACSDDVDLKKLAELTEGFSGAETMAVCQEAALHAMEEDLHALCVFQRHFIDAIKRITPRITPRMLEFYDNFRQRCGLRSV
ncbi:AAA+-type ATPase [Batrachochytrium dendrobatidis]|nr:AAA+-type ATPase [Batrachochytrium dendrobatidis]KAK5665158.1 AAA+-type ATPase [Batrachochytrium dendrobatidis]